MQKKWSETYSGKNMFSKFIPGSGGHVTGSPIHGHAAMATASPSHHHHPVNSILETNPISNYFVIGRQVGSAGPELIWKIHEATRRSDGKVSVSQTRV